MISTIILGLQTLNAWTGAAFAFVAVVTTVNALEPFFAWRDRWVLMEETQYRFYRLRDELTYYIAATKPDHLDWSKLREVFDEHQSASAKNRRSARFQESRRLSADERRTVIPHRSGQTEGLPPLSNADSCAGEGFCSTQCGI